MKFDEEDYRRIRELAMDNGFMKWLDLKYNMQARAVIDAAPGAETDEEARNLRCWDALRNLFLAEQRKIKR